jgi:hypothetical protein
MLDASGMTVNANVAGELRARLIDESAKPLEGLDFADCTPIRGDNLAHATQWKRNLKSVRGRPASVEFQLRDGNLYAFDLIA